MILQAAPQAATDWAVLVGVLGYLVLTGGVIWTAALFLAKRSSLFALKRFVFCTTVLVAVFGLATIVIRMISPPFGLYDLKTANSINAAAIWFAAFLSTIGALAAFREEVGEETTYA